MDESTYHKLADAVLEQMAEALEAADESGALDVELEGAMLTIALASGKHYLVSKHAPSQQLWVSSPLSGGLHFSYDKVTDSWFLPNGTNLHALVSKELAVLGNIQVVW